MSTPPTARSETHTATTEGLLPCPFCGGSGWCSSNRDKPPKKYNGYHGIVRCMACSACTTELGGETLDAALERAKERWNRRAGMAEPQAVAEVLEACEALLLELHLLRSCDTVRVSKNSAFITNIRRAVAKARGIAPDKNRTTASKPLPKPVKRRMYAIVGRRNVINAKNLFHTRAYADIVAATHSQRSVPVLVTVTPIRAKRARKGKR